MNRFHLNHLKLRDKLLLMYMLCVLIPIVMTNVFFLGVTTNNIRSQKIRDADFAFQQLQREFRAVIDEAAGISYLFYTDSVLNEHLDHTYVTRIEYVDAFNTTEMRGVFNKSEQAYRTIQAAVVYTDNPTILASGSIQPLTDAVKEQGWYGKFAQTKASYPVLIHDGGKISMVKRLDYLQGGSYSHMIKIDLKMDTIAELFANTGFDGDAYVLDPQRMVRFTNNKSVDWKTGTVALESLALPDKSISFTKTYENNNYLNGWSLYGVMDEKVMLQDVIKSRSFVIYLACINFLLPSLIIAAISRSIHVRLVRILKHMKKVKHQNFLAIEGEQARDEIGQLTGEFNRMTERINNLINDVYVADIQKKDLEIKQRQAQLHALHSQINPHFLFNALETIRMRSLIKGETETAKTIRYMAQIFRKSISWSRDWVTVREELELIQCFLEIQKYRFGDKLQYQITVDDAAYDVIIPKMSLVPFVENASIHGIESTPGIGLITVQIGFAEQRLVFRLTDNGIGMAPDKLAEIMAYLQADDEIGDHVGMKNAYYRLKLCYKDAFDFHILSEEGKGTSIELRLPLHV
ncbi:sensor histidine kinase [Paenibacillus chartarius]|uniref:Sensor histidine kinase n=1 Tax=Paenibacillus chartarius TaxID=747481 RepID=A0ABV6DP87_9BACL